MPLLMKGYGWCILNHVIATSVNQITLTWNRVCLDEISSLKSSNKYYFYYLQWMVDVDYLPMAKPECN